MSHLGGTPDSEKDTVAQIGEKTLTGFRVLPSVAPPGSGAPRNPFVFYSEIILTYN